MVAQRMSGKKLDVDKIWQEAEKCLAQLEGELKKELAVGLV